jgi:hypothetical protein
MKRHRRNLNQTGKKVLTDWNEAFDMKELFKSHGQRKKLKSEIQHLQLENKLNKQIRRFIDLRMDQLNERTTTGD